MEAKKLTLINAFETVEDFRVVERCSHKLIDIIVLTICAVICGAESWVDVYDFGIGKIDWLKKFLELPNGIPSHDTIGRVFSLLNASHFESCFLRWMQAVFEIVSNS